MRTLVLGATGFIGGALYRHLVGMGNDVTGSIGRDMCDLTTKPVYSDIFEGRNYDVVYMCAGTTGGSGLLSKDPLHFVNDNILMNVHLFAACKKYGVKKVVYASSTTAYPDTDAEMREEDYFTGELHGAYFNPGHTRRFIERLGEMYADHFATVFLRPSVVYGPGDDYNLSTSHVIPALVRKVAERQDPITVWGDGENWRDAVYIDDMVRALVLAADAPAGAYNIATGEGITVKAILDVLCLHARHFPEVKFDLTKPSMLKRRVLNTNRAREILGWTPRVRMVEGFARTLDWYASK